MIGRYVNDEMEKDVEGSGRGLIFRYYQTSAWRERLRKNTKNSFTIADLWSEI
jgi:hypothetical protein